MKLTIGPFTIIIDIHRTPDYYRIGTQGYSDGNVFPSERTRKRLMKQILQELPGTLQDMRIPRIKRLRTLAKEESGEMLGLLEARRIVEECTE